MDEKEKYEFNYKAPTPSEKKMIMSIRSEYEDLGKTKITNSDVDKLIHLDKLVKSLPVAISLSFGIIGTLIFSFGLVLTLQFNNFILGMILNILGILLLSIAYPIYNIIYKRRKNKYKKEILELSEKILNN